MINEVYEKQRELEDRLKQAERYITSLRDNTTELARSTSGLIDAFKGKHRVADERIAYLEKKIKQLQTLFLAGERMDPEADSMLLEFIGDKDAKATDVET